MQQLDRLFAVAKRRGKAPAAVAGPHRERVGAAVPNQEQIAGFGRWKLAAASQEIAGEAERTGDAAVLKGAGARATVGIEHDELVIPIVWTIDSPK